MLRIQLLGQPRLAGDDKPLKFAAPPKTWPLLAYLLLQRAQPLEREMLAFTLWPDEPEATARANLRRHLHHLQRALPPTTRTAPWLIVDAEAVQWNPRAPFWLDVAEFERLSAQPDNLAEAVALYGGDLLENAYDDWLFYPREQLRNLFFSDLNQLILKYRAERDYARAIAYAQRLLTHDPLREDATRQLMALRYQTGDRAGALQEYERFARRLRAELDVDPMPETAMVYETIVRNARLPASSPHVESAPKVEEKGARMRLPFVGREGEMEQLRAGWSRAARGRGGIVLIGGEAGIGKTRLASEFALLTEDEGARVLWGSTSAADPAPYQSVVEALASALPLLAALETEPLWLAALVPLLPELGARLKQPAPLAPLDPNRERARFFEALVRCLEGLAEPRSLLLVLEDCHWADSATTAWIEFAAARITQHPLLILITYREEEAPCGHPLRALRRRLQKENLATHLALGRIAPAAIARLIEQISGLGAAADELARHLYGASEGNPFFLNELIRDLLESGKVTVASGQWHIGSVEGDWSPRSVRDMIALRVARLSPQAQTFAEVAAVLGSSFDAELVRETAGWSEAQVIDSLNELLDHQVVREAGGRGNFGYVFSHHLMQSTLYAQIPEVSRKWRHRRVAHVMEELYPHQREGLARELAMHFDRGDEPARAANYYLSAARRALAVYADVEALGYLSRGLELATTPRTRAGLLAQRETVYGRRGEREAQRRDLQDLNALAIQLGDEDSICDAVCRHIHFQRALGDRQAEAALVESLKARAAASGLERWQAEALREQAAYQISIGEYDSASTNAERALALYESLGDASGQVQCHCLRVEIQTWQGRFDQVQTSLDRARSLSEVSTNRSLLIQVLRAASAAAFTNQDFQAANALGMQMLELCRQVGDLEGEADALTRLGTVEARLFQIQQAREHYERAAELYRKLGKRQGQAAVLINAGLLAANRLGRYAEGLEAFQKAEALFKGMNDLRGQMVSVLNMGMTAFFLGDFSAARFAAQRGLELARKMKSPLMEANALANLGAAERELGELSQAIEHMEAGLALRRPLGQPSDLGTDLCDLALAYLRAGNLATAQQAADELLTLYASAKQAMMRPEYVLWVAAQTYGGLGDAQRARELLSQAYAVLKEKAAAIPDEQSRASFLQFPFNREILTAYENKLY